MGGRLPDETKTHQASACDLPVIYYGCGMAY